MARNPASTCGGCGAPPESMAHVSGHRYRCINCGLSYLAAADGTQMDHKQFRPGEGQGLNVPPEAKPIRPDSFTGEPRITGIPDHMQPSPAVHVHSSERKVGWATRAFPDQAAPAPALVGHHGMGIGEFIAANRKPGAVEGKYGIITTTGKQLHHGEPVFILRATDPLAPDAIDDYADRCEVACCDPEHIRQCHLHAARIREWQAANPTLVKKLPD